MLINYLNVTLVWITVWHWNIECDQNMRRFQLGDSTLLHFDVNTNPMLMVLPQKFHTFFRWKYRISTSFSHWNVFKWIPMFNTFCPVPSHVQRFLSNPHQRYWFSMVRHRDKVKWSSDWLKLNMQLHDCVFKAGDAVHGWWCQLFKTWGMRGLSPYIQILRHGWRLHRESCVSLLVEAHSHGALG